MTSALRFDDADLIALRGIIGSLSPHAARFVLWGDGSAMPLLCELASVGTDPIVLAIDHDDARQRAVAETAPSCRFLHFRCLDLDGAPFADEGVYPSYASYPAWVKLRFDVAVIAGTRQTECAAAAAKVLAEGGIAVLAGAARPRALGLIAGLFDIVLDRGAFTVLRPRTVALAAVRSGERRAIVVPVRGSRAEREAAITQPFVHDYAARVGADCVVVGRDSDMSRYRLKSEALSVARDYDRCLLMDADVLIRPEAPDIFDVVPAHALGVFVEGRVFPRDDWNEVLARIDPSAPPVPSADYFNSGLMLFSTPHLRLLESLRDGTLYAHPVYEQGFLNTQRLRLGIPLFPLTPDFNYQPLPPFLPVDWRFASFLHIAGAGKRAFPYGTHWQDVDGDGRTFVARNFQSSDVRWRMLEQAAAQVRGEDIRIFDPADFSYPTPHGRLHYDKDGDLWACFPDRPEIERPEIAMIGPYATIGAGRWRLRMEDKDGAPVIPLGAELDIVCDYAQATIRDRMPWPPDGVVTFEVETNIHNIEFRIYRGSTGFVFSCLRLDRPPTDEVTRDEQEPAADPVDAVDKDSELASLP